MPRPLILIILFLALSAGATLAGWSEPVRISEHGGYQYPQMIANGDTLHIVYEDTRIYDKISYQRSTDGGLSWSSHQVISDRSDETLFPRIISSGTRLMVLWKKALTGYYRYTISYSVSTNIGVTWSAPDVVINPGWPYALNFAASGGTGLNINVVACTNVSGSLVFYSIRSTNFGQTWLEPVEIFSANQSGLPDQAGIGDFVHFTWDGRFQNSGPWDIYYLRSTDAGITWSTSSLLSSLDNHGSDRPSICIDEFDQVHVAWVDGKYSPYMLTGDVVTRQSEDTGRTWEAERQVSLNHYALGNNDIASIGDTIHVAWEDASSGLAHRSIYYTKSTDNGVTWDDPYWLDRTFDDSWTPVLATSNGRVYAAWGDGTYDPDTNSHWGLYFSRWDPDPSGIGNGNIENIPDKISLAAYPNPFNSNVTITYSNLEGGDIGIYDVQGKLVKILKTEAGKGGKIKWDAQDAMGNKVTSGIYFAKARTLSSSTAIKLIFLK